jgi:hypothetical protein
MRETLRYNPLPAIRPSLENVRHQFGTWRKKRRCRNRIPESLWQAAIGLCQEHSICEVSRTLGLNYNGLKNRATRAKDRNPVAGQGPDFGFVRLDLGVPVTPSECLVEMEAPNGARMRMSFKGVPRDFDPVELGRAFWRQGE